MTELFRTKLVRAFIVVFCLDASFCSGDAHPGEGIMPVDLPADFVAITNAASISRKPVLVECLPRWSPKPLTLNSFKEQSLPLCFLLRTSEWKNWATTNLHCFQITIDSPEDFVSPPGVSILRDKQLALAKELGVTSGIARIVLGPDGKRLGEIIADPNNEPYKFVNELCVLSGIDPPDEATWPGGTKWLQKQNKRARLERIKSGLPSFVRIVGLFMWIIGWKTYRASATVEDTRYRKRHKMGAIGLMVVGVLLFMLSENLNNPEEMPVVRVR